MHRNQLLITAITVQGLSYREAAHRYGVSKSLVHRLHQRWLAEGDTAFQPRSRAPRTSPTRIPDDVRARILELRHELLRTGSDAGADSIHEYLSREHVDVSRSTIWRILTHASVIAPQPQKRPRSSWIRFQAAQPNEMWQSDFTHHRLTTSEEVEIIGWIDDHSRYLLHLTAHPRVTGQIVVNTFRNAATLHGHPASTLTDNGMVYTTRLARGGLQAGLNSFETLLKLEGITQKNGRPYKPTTQGKIERFWQTLKRFLAQHPANTLTMLQDHLDEFTTFYNEIRPHRAIARRTPAFAYNLIPKAAPTKPDAPDVWQVRYDIVGGNGTVSIRHGGTLKHLGVGREHARTEIICLVHGHDATVITHTGEVLGEYIINPEKNYQAKNTRTH